MAQTYEAITTQTLVSAQSSITLSSIPQTYTDLIIVANTGYSAANYYTEMYFNGSTATDYSATFMAGTGSSAVSSRRTSYVLIPFDDTVVGTTTITSSSICHIFNYANTSIYKTALVRSNQVPGSAYPGVEAGVGLWRSTAAITSITLRSSNSGNFIIGSTFTLYGIKAA